MAFPSTPYVTAEHTSVGALTNPSPYVDLSLLGAEFWALVDTSDGTKGRVFKEDETELAVVWLSLDNGAETGGLRFKWSGTWSAAGANTVRIYPPLAARASVGAGDTFGKFNAFSSDLVMYLTLDEAATTSAGGYADQTQHNNPGTGVNMGEAAVAGQVGNAADFDGTDDFITIADDASFPSGAEARTISFWFNTDTFHTGVNDILFGCAAGGANGNGFLIAAEDQAVSIHFNGHRIITPKSALSTGTSYMCTVVVPAGAANTDDVLIYIDGVNQSLSDEVGSSQVLNTAAQGKSIGARRDDIWHTSCRMDDVQFRDTGWSADEVAEEFAATKNPGTYWGVWEFVATNEGEEEMALEIKKARGTIGRQAQSHERHSNQSESGANLTVSTSTGECRRILFVIVKYSGSASVSVTTTLNSGAGAAWDVILNTITLSAATQGLWIPDRDVVISADDVIDVFAPLLSSETSSVAIYSEIF